MENSDKKKFTYDRAKSTIYLLEDPSISLKEFGFRPEQGYVWVLGYGYKKIGLTTLDRDGTEYFPETASDGRKIRIIADIGVYVDNGSLRPPHAREYRFRSQKELDDVLNVIKKVFYILPGDGKFERGTGDSLLRFSDGMLERINNGEYLK
ncbi:hypothetical protein [Sneathiella glossodoripedis]|uniref:hypothetical protein n=1 Tax=Sneathiella glossodoripedis TaxID=418853 RepID=UPI0011DCF9F9|nr:hypothetical protein [Sneathiella glossodoripedis]